MSKPILLAICGKSGSGKNYIREYIAEIQTILPVNSLISYTTRPKRDYEKEGVDYHFITDRQFSEIIYGNQFLEYAQFNNWSYGTSIKDLQNDKLNVAILNPAGIKNTHLKHPEITTIGLYVDVNDDIRLRRILSREKETNIQEMIRRYQTDSEDFAGFPYIGVSTLDRSFDYYILKNNKENSLNLFKNINQILLTIQDKYAII